MADATKGFGKDLHLKIDTAGTTSGSTEVDVSRWLMSIDGLPGKREKADITCGGGAVGHEYIYGLLDSPITMKFLFDTSTGRCGTDSTAPAWTVFATATTGDYATRSFTFWPMSTAAGYPEIGGEMRVKSVVFDVKALDVLTFEVSAVVDSTCSVGIAA